MAFGLARRRRATVVGTASALAAAFLVVPSLHAHAAPLSLCGNDGPAPGVQHVIVVMLENESQEQVVGNAADAPYINTTLTKQCGYATHMFGATHYSAANYLAITAGQYPPESVGGCGYVEACDTGADNLFHQAATHGLNWKAYEESMPGPCYPTSRGAYSLGHNPVPFYDDLTGCAKYDVPVADLTQESGPFWNDLQNRTLPSFSFVTPDDIDNGHDDGTGIPAIDGFLSKFVPLVQQSNTYQDGNTALLVTFDEGTGGFKGEDCTDRAADMAGDQESCHIPFFVVSPYTSGGPVNGFFTHYSVTRTVEELLHLPLLAGATDAPSLATPFNLTAPPAVHQYVTNIGFETGSENGWTGVYTADSVTNPTQDDAYAGAWSLAISSSVPDATSSVGVTSKPSVIADSVAGTELTGSVWVRSSTPGVDVRQLVWERAPDGSSVSYAGQTVSLPDTAWHRVRLSAPLVAKNDGDSVLFSLYTTELPAGATLYADNFSLTSPS